MQVRALDSETFLIVKGVKVPRMVCHTWATSQGAGISTDPPAAEVFDGPVVFHNAQFDLCAFMRADPTLIRPIFDALFAGRIHCTMIRQMLADLHGGNGRQFSPQKAGHYTLATLVEHHLGEKLAKDDTFRLRFHELHDVPLEQWPEEATRYATDDAAVTLRVFERQIEADRSKTIYRNEAAQVRAHVALNLATARGNMLDADHVLALREDLRSTLQDLQDKMITTGYAVRKGGRVSISQKIVRRRVLAILGDGVRRTPTGAVKIDAESCTQAAVLGGDEGLKSLVEFKWTQKMLSTYVDRYADDLPSTHGGKGLGVVQPEFNILVGTGRTSLRAPNLQNLPRDPRFRQCFRARPGYVLIACDFNAAELHTLAQSCLDIVGRSALADALNAGLDPHLSFAADAFLKCSYTEALALKKAGASTVKEARQQAKAANFGYPGGLGDLAFQRYATGYGLALTLKDARTIREGYDKQWPEVREWHATIRHALNGRRPVEFMPTAHRLYLPRAGRYRAGVRFTQAANTLFQGPAADGAKQALFELTRACFTKPASPLYGVRPINFVHDEVISECPEDRAHEAAMEMERLMAEVFTRTATPDVPCKAEATIMRSWTKADPVWRDGRLIPVEDAA